MGETKKMVAATGFQRGGYEHDELKTTFKNILKTKDKFIEYTRFSLRSAKDIFKKGGHVTSVFKDQVFRLFYDNRREIQESKLFKASNSVDMSNILLNSKPLNNINECKTQRFLSKFPITNPFNTTNSNRAGTLYKSRLEIGVRNFIKGYYSSNETYGFTGTEFRYAREIIDFIYGIESTKSLRLSLSSISKLKNRRIIQKPVPHTRENIELCAYIKKKFPHFRDDLFLKTS